MKHYLAPKFSEATLFFHININHYLIYGVYVFSHLIYSLLWKVVAILKYNSKLCEQKGTFIKKKKAKNKQKQTNEKQKKQILSVIWEHFAQSN